MQRRDFLKNALAGTVGMGLATSGTVLSQFLLARSALAASQTTFTDHKALVCIYLAGGNDSMNMLIPTDASYYSQYTLAKQSLAIPVEGFSAISPKTSNNYKVGLNKNLGQTKELFDRGRLSILANIGTLRQPIITKKDLSNAALLPPQLFSHNDQTVHWMRGSLDPQITTGWAGRMADMINATANSGSKVSMNFSLGGNNRLQVGGNSTPFVLDVDGVVDFNSLKAGTLREGTFNKLKALAEKSGNLMEKTYAKSFSKMQGNVAFVKGVLDGAKPSKFTVVPGVNSLIDQLSQVANLIGQQRELKQQRQLFFVKLGGWDTHDDQVENHAALLKQLDDALWYFDQRLTELGKQNAVTTFTLSEFGRTLSSNGDGTDHGWGGNQFVMGGAVAGGDIYGKLPSLALGGDDDYSNAGRMIPRLAFDQMTATLLRWFGLSPSQISGTDGVLPNLVNFGSDPYLKFMRS